MRGPTEALSQVKEPPDRSQRKMPVGRKGHSREHCCPPTCFSMTMGTRALPPVSPAGSCALLTAQITPEEFKRQQALSTPLGRFSAKASSLGIGKNRKSIFQKESAEAAWLHPSIPLPPFTHTSMHPSIHSSIHPSFSSFLPSSLPPPSTHLSLSIPSFTYPLIHPPIHQPSLPSSLPPSIHVPTHALYYLPSIHPSMHLPYLLDALLVTSPCLPYCGHHGRLADGA